MAQICGVQNHQRTTTTTTTTTMNIIQGSTRNSFVLDGGIEFMLHELDPPALISSIAASSNPNSLPTSTKKRGRPRKDAPQSAQSSFEASPSPEEKRLKRERKKLLRMEQKKEKKLMKRLKIINCNEDEKENVLFENLDADSSSNIQSPVAKKRGRPRKLPEPDHQEIFQLSLSNSETLTPIQSDLSASEADIFSGISSTRGHGEEQLIMENLSLNLKEECTNEIESIETKWTPIQRLTQLNQALAFTRMYKDIIFWDRIVAEFTQQSLRLRLDLGTEKSYDIPFLVLSKFFWVCAQLGMQRIQFLFTGLSEKLENDELNHGGILFNSSDSLIYSHLFNDKILVNQRASQLIKFDSSAKISNWTVQIKEYEEFRKSDVDGSEIEELIWGIPKRAIEFLEVALVMSSVLTDSVSWLTWFYTYIQQTGLKNFSIVELSRPPSPFHFPANYPSNLPAAGIEFFEKGRDFIFSVLNTAPMMEETQGFDVVGNEMVDLQLMATAFNSVETCEAQESKDYEQLELQTDNYELLEAQTKDYEQQETQQKDYEQLEIQTDDYIQQVLNDNANYNCPTLSEHDIQEQVTIEELLKSSEPETNHFSFYESPMSSETEQQAVESVDVVISEEESEPVEIEIELEPEEEEDNFFDSYN